MDLEGLSVRNQTTGRAARALRIFPDGSFDALVELAPGQNLLRIEARARDGSTTSEERLVTRDEVDLGPEESRQAARWLEALRVRTRELELWAELERHRKAFRQAKEIELDGERGPNRQQGSH